jgi:hypothetical protein
MNLFKHPGARATSAAVTMIGALVLAGPLFASSGNFPPAAANQSPVAPVLLAKASSQTAMAAPMAESAGPAAVEAHIRDLHKKLHITAAQKPQWDDLAQVMRNNALAMMDLQKERNADAQSMTAVDFVKSYELVIEAHDAGMKKFIPPFEALYDTMSDAQKKSADSLFRTRERVSAAKQTAENK